MAPPRPRHVGQPRDDAPSPPLRPHRSARRTPHHFGRRHGDDRTGGVKQMSGWKVSLPSPTKPFGLGLALPRSGTAHSLVMVSVRFSNDYVGILGNVFSPIAGVPAH